MSGKEKPAEPEPEIEEEEEEDGPSKKTARGIVRNLQKRELDKLMANPEKLAPVPEAAKEWRPRDPPEFCRFYMGSSAGAGSEVFHVYRHLRRYENTRQQWIEENATKEDKDLQFLMTLAARKTADEERTAKKRAKRLRKKQRQKQPKKESADNKEKVVVEEEVAEKEVADDEDDDEKEEDEDHENCFVIGGR